MSDVSNEKSGGGRRTQQERRDATRSALLASAAAVVVDTGPGTGTAEVARKAGVSKGALQHHFGSKNDLLVAVVASGWSDLTERFAQLADVGAAPDERVSALVSAMWDSYQHPTCLAAFMISSDPNLDPELAERLAPIFVAARVRLDQVWSDAFADLDVTGNQLAHARRFVRSHLIGMLVQRQLPSEEPAPDKELSMLCEATLQLLRMPAT
jgi:AcrR family transcriptional regulator